jgi:hypothetical protein
VGGGGGTQRSVLRANEPKNAGRAARQKPIQHMQSRGRENLGIEESHEGPTCFLFCLLFIQCGYGEFSDIYYRRIVSKCDELVTYTAKTKYRNFETNIPRKGISGS